MAQIGADSAAQRKADTAGPFINTAVIAGKAVFKDAGQILFGNTDAGIPNAQGFGQLQRDGNPAAVCLFKNGGNQQLK